jgi:DNA-binding transcriptional MocR family regulator
MLLYEDVATKIGEMIDHGTYRPGDRVPSIRDLSRKMRVSINTVIEAYAHLENCGMIEARPQSGFYVCSRALEPKVDPLERKAEEELISCCVSIEETPRRIMRSLSDASLVPLGVGIPNPDLLPVDKLNRMLSTESRRFPMQSVSYAGARGTQRLRTQIAKRALNYGCTFSPDQWMGLKILEIPSTPQEGMSIEVLNYAIRHNPVHACLVISNFNNPLGSVIPGDRKRELVTLLAQREIPLIEDDVYGDLAFGPSRPAAVKAYDEKGLVLYCSSFSKTLAPGYRVGWIVPGKYQRRVRQLKAFINIATASPTQLAIAEFLTNGGYDHHLRRLCRVYSRQVAKTRDAVGRYFPPGTRQRVTGSGTAFDSTPHSGRNTSSRRWKRWGGWRKGWLEP